MTAVQPSGARTESGARLLRDVVVGVHRLGVLALLLIGASVPLTACGQADIDAAQKKRAFAMYEERCKTAGEFIHKTVDGVEGIFLINVRTSYNHDDQFRLDDPYGKDSTGDEYVLKFLRGFWHQEQKSIEAFPDRVGYRFVEARDPKDSKLYRYTGRFEEPWQTNKSYLKGYIRFVLDKAPINVSTARYGLRFEDISTRQLREHWIAGSSLKVIDLSSQELIAERVGYMVDWAQGSRAGRRSPWLFAADNACPEFRHRALFQRSGGGSAAQSGQTLDFAQKVLKPSP